MLNRKELQEIAKIRGEKAFFVTLYLNVDPSTNAKSNYLIHLKNMIKETIEKTDKAVLKKISADLEKIESFILTEKRSFKKGLALLSSHENKFWKIFHLAVPLKNEIIVDSTPYVKPLLDLLDNYQRYAIMLVGRDTARIFLVHLGEIEEYTEVRSDDVPGRHKKGGWFSLAERSYERHIDYHVELHLKDVIRELGSFLTGEYVGRLLIGGSEEAVSRVREMLPQRVSEKIIGTFQADMQSGIKEILEKADPILKEFEEKREEEDVAELVTKAMKNENAVIGVEDVLNALQDGRIMKLLFLKDFKKSGLLCLQCGYLTTQNVKTCPYCKGNMKKVRYLVDHIAQKSVEQGALIEVVNRNTQLREAGSIGAFLRF